MRSFRRIVSLLLIASLLSSCSSAVQNDDSSDADNLSAQANNAEPIDAVYVEITKCDGRFTGGSGQISVDIEDVTGYPLKANSYSYTEEYPSEVNDDDYLRTGHWEGLDEYNGLYSWNSFYDVVEEGDSWNPDLEPLFSSCSLGWSYEMSDSDKDDLTFTDYVLSDRRSIDITQIDLVCRDLIAALGLDESCYKRAIYCSHCSPDDTVWGKYDILQSVDGIDIFEISVYPQRTSRLNLIRIGDWFGLAGSGGLLITSFVNGDNDTCIIDIMNYEILDTIDEDLEILSLDDIIGEGFYVPASTDGYNGPKYFYLADLVYMPIQILDEESGDFTGDRYLYPCWILFYTGAVSGSDLSYEIDGVLAFDAITGENIDIDDRIYWDKWDM